MRKNYYGSYNYKNNNQRLIGNYTQLLTFQNEEDDFIQAQNEIENNEDISAE